MSKTMKYKDVVLHLFPFVVVICNSLESLPFGLTNMGAQLVSSRADVSDD